MNNKKLLFVLLVFVLFLTVLPAGVSAMDARSRLIEKDQMVYDTIKTQIQKVAAGESDSSVFTADCPGFQSVWTWEELGANDIEEAANKLFDKMFEYTDAETIVTALKADLPYDLYWMGESVGYSWNGVGTLDGTEVIFPDSYDPAEPTDTVTITIQFLFDVSPDYGSGTTITRTADIDATVQGIVDAYAEKSDYEKLLGYAKEICDLVDYNASVLSDPSVPYGDPWQVVSVFDRDEDTKVVCEGYSKAFKHLCDLTTFDSDEIECYLVTGILEGGTGAGPHMWNVVKMENGQNYLVDITNCDTHNDPARLLLRGGEPLSPGVYQFDEMTFTYDDEAWNLWPEAEVLTLATEDYTPSVIEYDLWVGATQVTSENKNDILEDGGSAKYAPATKTLMLNSPTITEMTEGALICAKGIDLTVSVVGDTVLTSDSDDCVVGIGVQQILKEVVVRDGLSVSVGGSLTVNISPDCKLTLNAKNAGLYADKTLLITGGEIESTGGMAGIYSNGEIVIEDGNVKTVGANYGMYAWSGVMISGSEVRSEGNTPGSYGTYSDGKVEIANSTYYSTRAYLAYAIYAKQSIEISGASTVILTEGSKDSLHSDGSITIADGNVEVSGYLNGIYAYGDIYIKGGTLTARSYAQDSSYAIYSETGRIQLKKGIEKVTAIAGVQAAGKSAICSPNGTISIDDTLMIWTPSNGTLGSDKHNIYGNQGTFVAVMAEIIPKPLPGDLNGDGNVTRKDLAMLSKYLRNKEANPLSEKALLAANLNGDKDVNRKDLAILSKHLRNPELYPLS